MTDILRELLGPMLPEGVSYDDLYPLTEALAKPGPLASDRTARRERRPPPEADEYRRLLKRQERLRGTYRNELRKLLKLAEEEGPTYQTKALKKFSQLAKRFMTDAHQLGMKLSLKTPPKGPDMVAQNYIKERVNHDRSHFTDFLQAIWGGTEHMKRAQRRDLYVNALDSMFVQGAIAGQADDVLISWKLCISTPDSRVVTSRGLIPISEVVVGDQVWTHKERWKPVTNVIRRSGVGRQIVHVQAPTGKMVGCTDDHTWFSSSGWKCLDHIVNVESSIYTLDHETLSRLDRSELLPDRQRRTETFHGKLRDRGWKANGCLPVSVALGESKWIDSEGVCSPPSQREQTGRQLREFGIDQGSKSSSRSQRTEISTKSNLQVLSGSVSDEIEKRNSTSILFDGMSSLGDVCDQDLSALWHRTTDMSCKGEETVLFDEMYGAVSQRETDDKVGETLYDITVEDDHSFVIEGMVSANSPAEHCRDCLALAAYAPYVKPGVKSKHPELPTIPRRGDTQCLSRCKCYLTYKHGITGEPVDPQPRPGFRPEPREDGEPVPVVPDPLQKELDKLHADMLYFRTQYEITQDEAWLKMRREANKRVIEIQDALGARLVPGVEADYMVKQVAQAVKDGWEPAVAVNDARRFARSQVVGAAKGTEFYRGTLTSWDQKRGEGKMMDISGQEIVVGTDPKHSTVMMSRGASTPDRPWRVPRDGDETFSTTFKNSTSSYRTNLPETVDDASMIKTINSVIESRPKEETHNTHFVVRQGTKSSRQVVVDKDKTANIIHTVGGNPQKLTITEKNVRQSVALTIKKRLDEIPAFQAKWNAAIQRVALMKTKRRYVGGATSPLDEYTDFLNDFVQDVKYDDAEFAKAYDLFVAEPEVLKREVPDIFSVMSEALGYLKEFEGFSIFKGSSDDLVNEFGEDE